MDKAKERNEKHAYLSNNLAQMPPFSYTKFKIPNTSELGELTPLTNSLKIMQPDLMTFR